MVNQASLRRVDFARRIGAAYASHPKVAAVIIAGSAARGQADSFSDLEIGVFWHSDPLDADRQSAVETIHPESVRFYPYDAAEQVWCDDLRVRDAAVDPPATLLLVEVVNISSQAVDNILHDVHEKFDPDLVKQNLVSSIMDGIALYGDQSITAWRNKVSEYPDALAYAMVSRYAQIDHFWRWKMWIQRGNLMMLHAQFSEIQKQVLYMLLGLNHRYYFGLKWIDVINERLIYKPDSLVNRFNNVHQADPSAGAEQLRRLVEETYDLLETHMPALDVNRLRAIFRYKREEW